MISLTGPEPHVIGATFSASCVYRVNGSGVPLSGYSGTCKIATTAGDLVGTLTVTLANQGTNPGEFTLSATAASQAQWVEGDHIGDVKFTNGTTVIYTPRFGFPCRAPITA